MSQRSRRVVGAVTVVAFALLVAAVALGLTQSLDTRLRDAFRPGDAWGPLQVRVDVVVEGLKPVRTLSAFVVLVLGLAVVRRSWAPVSYAAVLLAVAGLPAAAVKGTLARTDPHHDLSSLGSFPSGHVLVLLVCLGGSLLLVRETPAAWEWCCVVAAVGVMALALLVQAAHWFTDVLGGGLLGVAALAAVGAGGRRRRQGSVTPARHPALVKRK